MRLALVAVLALTTAAPVVSVPTVADAQVLVGSGAAPRRAPRRPALSEAEQDRLYAAEDTVAEINDQLAEIQALADAAGGLTEEQSRQVADLTRRRDAAQRTVDRLERKRDR